MNAARWPLLACLAMVSGAAALPASHQTPPELVILSPQPDTVLKGQTVLAAEVRPADVPVREVVFYVSGERACVVAVLPFRCLWEAGGAGTARDIRVEAQLADGTRLVRALRTRGAAPSFRASADSVLLTVHVRDRNKRFIRGLDASSFRVLEDGVPQEVLSFSSDAVASDILVALDVSGSMQPALAELKAAAAGFLSSLRPADAVTLAAFNTSLFVLSPHGSAPATRLAALDGLRASGSTALYDVMIQGADLMKNSGARRAMVMLTDGDDISSRSSLSGARMALQSSDVVLYVIAQGKAASDAKLRDQINTLALETGGAAFLAPRMSELKDHFAEIVEELTSQYVLGYAPRRPFGDGGWRQITVETTDRNKHYEVRARQGYLAVRRGG
jgi:Ca-activated chloride channel family protein